MEDWKSHIQTQSRHLGQDDGHRVYTHIICIWAVDMIDVCTCPEMAIIHLGRAVETTRPKREEKLLRMPTYTTVCTCIVLYILYNIQRTV